MSASQATLNILQVRSDAGIGPKKMIWTGRVLSASPLPSCCSMRS